MRIGLKNKAWKRVLFIFNVKKSLPPRCAIAANFGLLIGASHLGRADLEF